VGRCAFYQAGRFFTVTGDHLPGTPQTFEERQTELDALLQRLGARTIPEAATNGAGTPPEDDPPARPPDDTRDAAMIAQALAQTLFPQGDLSRGGTHHSQGDFRFCMTLAALTGGHHREIDRLVRLSPRMTAKWDSARGGATWGAVTIRRAVAFWRERQGSQDHPNGEMRSHDATPGTASLDDTAARWPLLTPADLLQAGPEADLSWVIRGLAAKRHATNIPGLWKVGKTTLLCHTITAVATGVPFCGLETTPGRILIVSEEHISLWKDRQTVFQWPDQALRFILRPFPMGAPSPTDWLAFIAYLRGEAPAFDLVIMDSIHNLWGVTDENDNAETRRWLAPLEGITDAGPALILAGQPSKSDQSEGRLSRGAGAIGGWVSIIAELRRFNPQDRDDTRRVIDGFSRWDATPTELVIDLRDGTYTAVGSRTEVRSQQQKAESRAKEEAVLAMLPDQAPGFSANDLRERWPDERVPAKRSLDTYLRRLWSAELAGRTGEGKAKGDPFRFYQRRKWVAGQVKHAHGDPRETDGEELEEAREP
jgi:hypothetical protein